MKITARVWGDVARYYRSNQGKAALVTLGLAIAGVVSGKKTLVTTALVAFGSTILPLSAADGWRHVEHQDATRKELDELSAAIQDQVVDLELERMREFETDVILARARDLTRLDAIERRLDHLEANQ